MPHTRQEMTHSPKVDGIRCNENPLAKNEYKQKKKQKMQTQKEQKKKRRLTLTQIG